MFEWYVVTCGCDNKHQKGHSFKKDWITCLKHATHSRFYSQHGWGHLYMTT